MLASAAQNSHVLTFEDGLRDGGIGMAIADRITSLNSNVNVRVHGVPTKFIPQAKPDAILAQFGLDANGIVTVVRHALHG
jgi:1-deoxy-D-xylulose-5-phosphate synthase